LFQCEEAIAVTSSLPASEFHREKLSSERVTEMRRMVEGSTLSFRRIAQALGLSAATVSRYARLEGWQRPAGAPPAPEPDSSPPAPSLPSARREPPPVRRREQIVDRLWTLAERHAEILETQPIERAERSLQPLARLTRTLGEMDKHVRPPLPAHEYEKDYAIDAPKPRRSLHELRDELAAHLERIQREEGYGWEVREWWFKDGGGI
jgi:transposase